MSVGQALKLASINTLAVMAFATLIVAASWFWLSSQLHTLLQQRINESGDYYSQIAAIAASEAIVSGDLTYLESLAARLIEEPFIDKLAFYSSDGTLILEQTINEQKQEPSRNDSNWSEWLNAYLPRYQNAKVDFMPEVIWNNEMVGWTQLTIDRHFLEKDIRESSFQVTAISLAILTLTLMITFTFSLTRTLNRLSKNKEIKEDKKRLPLSLSEASKLVKQHKQQLAQLQFKKPSIISTPTENFITLDELDNHLILTVTLNFITQKNVLPHYSNRLKVKIQKLYRALRGMATNLNLTFVTNGRQFIIYSLNGKEKDCLQSLLIFGYVVEKLSTSIEQESFSIKAILEQPKKILLGKTKHHIQLIDRTATSTQIPFGIDSRETEAACALLLEIEPPVTKDSFAEWLDSTLSHIAEHHLSRVLQGVGAEDR